MGAKAIIEVRAFLRERIIGLTARARRLSRIDYDSVGIRPRDLPFVPSPDHFKAANERLASIDHEIARRVRTVQREWTHTRPQRVLIDIALVEREIDRARRAFGMFFEVFSQRGSVYAPALAAHDVIARRDCYDAVRQDAPRLLSNKALAPVTYMEHGYSPATMRRGVVLTRLLGESNPFPVIRIPWDRDNPWQPVFIHEIAHNLHADMGIWYKNKIAVTKRVMTATGDPRLAVIYGRWHKEIFADLAAMLLSGPAVAWGMALFLAHPAPRALTYRVGAHPTGFLRVLLLVEMLRRMGFATDAARLDRVWRNLYNPRRFHRLPERLLRSADSLMPHIVDEIAYQTRRNLAHRALADVIKFRREDEEAILAGKQRLVEGRLPDRSLPPRFLVSAASYALQTGRLRPRSLSAQVIGRLTEDHPPAPVTISAAQAALAS